MRIAVTGASGFLGWHLRCRAFALGIPTVGVSREVLADPDALAGTLAGVDAVVHCAGVSRGSHEQVTDGNLAAATALAEGLRLVERRRPAGPPPRVVYANSVHANSVPANSVPAGPVRARGDSDGGGYGAAKRKAAELLAGAAPSAFSDVVLPNLFGEHGRAHHNSVVATFCHHLARGRTPPDVRDRELTLLHAQDAADVLLRQARVTGVHATGPAGEPTTVGEVLRLLTAQAAAYRGGDLPDLSGPFRTRLFHTYRSHLFPAGSPVPLPLRGDARGDLVECVRARGGAGQAFVSTTRPGAVRGEHVHLRKLERFVVVAGAAEIALRRLFTSQVVRFRVDGTRPAFVDIPTLWTHRLTCRGDRPATTLFWTSELFDPADPDTYACGVDRSDGQP